MITAEQAARALVASARDWGVDPLKVFEPENRMVRASAAERCVSSEAKSHLEMLARVFQVPLRKPAEAAA